MYTDPSLIRQHVIKLSLNDREHELVQAASGGEQVAVWARRVALKRIAEEMRAAGFDIPDIFFDNHCQAVDTRVDRG